MNASITLSVDLISFKNGKIYNNKIYYYHESNQYADPVSKTKSPAKIGVDLKLKPLGASSFVDCIKNYSYCYILDLLEDYFYFLPFLLFFLSFLSFLFLLSVLDNKGSYYSLLRILFIKVI